MNLVKDNYIEEVLKRSKEMASDLQPWPNYFDSKMREFKTISHLYKFSKVDSILEVGCGNGFTASLLTAWAERVVAFDVPFKNQASHSIGIKIAKELMERLKKRNVEVIGGSVEDLPFSDNAFDLIFSEYVLNYIKDKDDALQEMRRVLSPKGSVITVVPNFTERIFATLIKYEYLLKKALMRKPENKRNCAVYPETACFSKGQNHVGRILDEYFFLRADGPYRSFVEEIFRHTPTSWELLFKKNGFKIIDTFSTQILPLGLFDLLGSSAVRFLSKNTYQLNNILGGLPAIKDIGFSLALVAVKD